MKGSKFDGEKDRWDLLPWRATEQAVKVMTFGARKYAPENWRKVPEPKWRYFAATLRHLVAWWRGEKNDPQSGLPHLAHALCCLLFLCELEQEGKLGKERGK